MRSGSTKTRDLNWFARGGLLRVPPDRQFRVDVEPLLVGRHESADVTISDPEVSALHCELRGVKEGILVRDLGSANGTIIGGCAVREGLVRAATTITVGSTRLEIEPDRDAHKVDAGRLDTFGDLYGNTPEMRRINGILARAAATELSILLLGETGTGKGLSLIHI